jgi:hypothetical protein
MTAAQTHVHAVPPAPAAATRRRDRHDATRARLRGETLSPKLGRRPVSPPGRTLAQRDLRWSQLRGAHGPRRRAGRATASRWATPRVGGASASSRPWRRAACPKSVVAPHACVRTPQWRTSSHKPPSRRAPPRSRGLGGQSSEVTGCLSIDTSSCTRSVREALRGRDPTTGPVRLLRWSLLVHAVHPQMPCDRLTGLRRLNEAARAQTNACALRTTGQTG